MENISERLKPTPTEASKRFLKGWGDSIVLSLNIASATSSGFIAGVSLVQGHNEVALLSGIAAGCLTAASILKVLSANIKAREK